MSQAFYRKWRPQKWDEVVAQAHVIQTLRNAVRTGHTGHAYLLAGPRGTGKTTTARLLAKALNCLDPDPAQRPCDQCGHCLAVNEGRFMDLVEIDAASNTSVDDMRDLREKINYRPSQGEYKVYIIDEVHMLSTAAFNALLKTLEEPPPHAVFVLATTEVHKIPATILSRVQRYEFRRIPVPDIVHHLQQMSAEEGLAVDEDALWVIARQATGAMRDAISLLDQLASTGERVTLAEAQQVLGTATSGLVLELVQAVLDRDAASGLKGIQSALDAGTDARQFARQVVDYLRSVLLMKLGNADQVDATSEMRARMAEHAVAFDAPQLLEAIRLFNSAATDTRSSWHPGLALELAVVESAADKAQPAAGKAQPAAGKVQPAADKIRPEEELPSSHACPARQARHRAAPGQADGAVRARAGIRGRAAPSSRRGEASAGQQTRASRANPGGGAAPGAENAARGRNRSCAAQKQPHRGGGQGSLYPGCAAQLGAHPPAGEEAQPHGRRAAQFGALLVSQRKYTLPRLPKRGGKIEDGHA